jgi:hypothetical protein
MLHIVVELVVLTDRLGDTRPELGPLEYILNKGRSVQGQVRMSGLR